MTDFYALKRYEPAPRGWNWGLIFGLLWCLFVWAVVFAVIFRAFSLKQAFELFLQKVGLGG